MESQNRAKTVLERNKFFATTNIAGFGLIQSSSYKLETVIWYIVIAVFTGITIYNIITLTIEYKNQETTAAVHLATWDGNLGDDVFVEVPIVIPELYDEFYDNTVQYPFLYPYNHSLAADLDEAIAQLDSREKLVGKDASWPPVLIPLLSRFTCSMHTFEIANMEKDQVPIEIITEKYMKRIFPYVTKFRQHCAKFNITDNELMTEWFEHIMTMFFSIYTIRPRKTAVFDHIPVTADSFNLVTFLQFGSTIGGIVVYKMGFQLKKNIVLERNDQFYWEVNYKYSIDTIRTSGVLGENINYENIINWFQEKHISNKINAELILYKDIERKEMLLQVPFSRNSGYSVKTVYSFQSLHDNQINNCSQTRSKGRCLQECYGTYFMNSYHCTPMIFGRHSNTNLSMCSMEDFGELKNTSNENNCNNCPENCNQDVLTFDQWLSDDSSQARMLFSLKPKFTQHPVFVEMHPKSQTEFWADLGGTFDFWIGASVISAVHLIVYFCKQFVYAFRKNTKTGRNLRNVVHGLRNSGQDPTQMITLLTLGLSQEQNNKENNAIDQVELLKIIKQQEESLKNVTEQQEKLFKTVVEHETKRVEQEEKQLKTLAEQEQRLKDIFTKQINDAIKKFSK